MANIILVSAPSGAGKTSIIKNILNKYQNIVFSVSATTRPKRDGEIEGVDYFFLTKEDFDKKIKNNEFIEYEKFFDNYYGTLKSFVEDSFAQNKSVLMEIDVNGAQKVKQLYPDALTIFIEPPSRDAVIERLKNRNTETEEKIQKRIERFDYEMSFKDKYKYVIKNVDLNNAIKEFEEILKQEKII
ncbi:MAG TPA: guanylate kinase [Ignavibacteriales bacterium]|nr:guanylate kinase [Ignavibacteriales bacterium]HOL81025.1 guanylate kinase [Ignavibacteriales bacterium]HOM64761.1 guanylate kinase [Ignavibacteriales bacterium]HPP32805.1 guanylate kinase [Ignavibacteriales bacterium]